MWKRKWTQISSDWPFAGFEFSFLIPELSKQSCTDVASMTGAHEELSCEERSELLSVQSAAERKHFVTETTSSNHNQPQITKASPAEQEKNSNIY